MLVGALITFLVVILILYLINLLPIDGRAKQIARVVVIIIGIISLLKYLAAEKAVEDTVQDLGWDAGSRVRDREQRLVMVTAERQAEVPSGLVILHRIVREDQQELAQLMNNHRAGDTVRITIYRGKKKLEVSVVLGEARQEV
jgi:hypothetical protein